VAKKKGRDSSQARVNWGTSMPLFRVHCAHGAVTLLTHAHHSQGDNPMSKAATPQRWFTGWRVPSAGAAVPGTDPADLGTAFGLDMSLHELQHEPQPRAPQAAPRAGWMRRLAGRGKPGA
jgi:hypothetical protein